jgi:DNA (cytosine-5)-methyltransferase 1
MKRKQNLLPFLDESGEELKGAPAANETAPWRRGWDLTEERIEFFRQKSVSSARAKKRALRGQGRQPLHPINVPRLDPSTLMPRLPPNGLRALSLFSGGGGLDLAFDLAGFEHVASYDILEIAGETLCRNRPEWKGNLFTGPERGDVCRQNWSRYDGRADVLHGGPPCQPFSMAGRQLGSDDTRDMFPEFVRAVLTCRPRAFVAENVAALSQAKFQPYLEEKVLRPLSCQYLFDRFELRAEWFGVPQQRVRHFIVGFRSRRAFGRFRRPEPTHAFQGAACAATGAGEADLFSALPQEAGGKSRLQRTMGVREALGLPDLGRDDLAPTLRSGFTGPRGATSVNSSTAALHAWGRLGIWPHGVAPDRTAARRFAPENGHFRLSVLDCGIIQGFPENWTFCGPVYAVLGQIGNSVAPPVGYRVALAVARALVPPAEE